VLAVRHWNSPPSLIQQTRVRYVIAIALAALQIVGWGVLIVVLIGMFYAR